MPARVVKRQSGRRVVDDPPSVAFVRRVLIALVVVHIPLALWSGYRAIVQVQRLELEAPEQVLHSGSTVRVAIAPRPALLRATARGRPQWLREPPPEVREVRVEIAQPRT